MIQPGDYVRMAVDPKVFGRVSRVESDLPPMTYLVNWHGWCPFWTYEDDLIKLDEEESVIVALSML